MQQHWPPLNKQANLENIWSFQDSMIIMGFSFIVKAAITHTWDLQGYLNFLDKLKITFSFHYRLDLLQFVVRYMLHL